MVTLDELMDVGEPQRRTGTALADAAKLLRAGLYWIGWALAKLVFLVLLAVGGFFYSLGWITRRLIWPALVWMGSAVRVGWEDGRKRAEHR